MMHPANIVALLLFLKGLPNDACHAFKTARGVTQRHNNHPVSMMAWRPLPHVHIERRNVLASGASWATSHWLASSSSAAAAATRGVAVAADMPESSPRLVAAVNAHGSIPVWPTWGGGRVVPISFSTPSPDVGSGGTSLHDPFLLLAHHDHWFDPRDPLRKPFQAFGSTLGLPYIDVEGFKMHPHRGFDIWTYILDGSDGFQHRDSLGETTKLYRGGSAQWMRTGSGVMHEEFWETSDTRRTNIELFQLWVNLPASHKMDPPAIHYVGQNTPHPWLEQDILDPIQPSKVVGRVRNLGETLNQAISSGGASRSSTNIEGATSSTESISSATAIARSRPPVNIYHVKLDAGAQWTVPVPPSHSVILYVRKGSVGLSQSLPLGDGGDSTNAVTTDGSTVLVAAQETATFVPFSGNCIHFRTNKNMKFDGLLLTAEPLQESTITAGPIVMNSQREIQQAYQQLKDGTFLDRDLALQQHNRLQRRS
jgi:quercetin 2,3-dioxygenase